MYAFNHIASFYYQKYVSAMINGHYVDSNIFGEINLTYMRACSEPEDFARQYLLLNSTGYKKS